MAAIRARGSHAEWLRLVRIEQPGTLLRFPVRAVVCESRPESLPAAFYALQSTVSKPALDLGRGTVHPE